MSAVYKFLMPVYESAYQYTLFGAQVLVLKEFNERQFIWSHILNTLLLDFRHRFQL